MGLDQYVWATDQDGPWRDRDTDFEFDALTDDPYSACFAPDPVFEQLFVCKPGWQALAYFRKHPNLHGFIQTIYEAKGGTDIQWGSFSGPVVLGTQDIDAIEANTKMDTLPETKGFFFGQSIAEDYARTLEMCARARAAIAEGKTVIYDSSW